MLGGKFSLPSLIQKATMTCKFGVVPMVIEHADLEIKIVQYALPSKPSKRNCNYNAEVQRILYVLKTVLSGQDWLVSKKMTYADLTFVP